MHSLQNEERSDLLVHGFVRTSQSDANHFPSDGVQIIFNFYFSDSLIAKWIDQDMLIYLVEDEYSSDEDTRQLIWRRHCCGVVLDFIEMSEPYSKGKPNCTGSIWRLYPVSEHDNGFILKNVSGKYRNQDYYLGI